MSPGQALHTLAGPILVTGASGNMGRATLRALRARGLPVRAGLRDGGASEVETVRLDFGRPETFAAAVAGASGLLLVRPPAISDVRPTLCALVDAALAAGLRRVVFLSVIGAERRGYIPHAKVEHHLQGSAAAWTMLRAGFFAQNLGDVYRNDIRERDELFIPAGAGRAAFVDVRDLGEVAARCFSEDGHAEQAYTLTGPEALGFAEVAALLSAELGRAVHYRRASALGYAARLRRQGLPWGQVAVQTILHVGLRFGQAEAVDPTLPRLLGRPAGTLAAYIADHRSLWT
ncbi:MAG: NmrA family NAD(P)-binding protein [Nannocystis sp.]|uniref:NmrA family NAD(P)-binding protein n=1 Tax=Nannocystis sp. TaxID=1962667 RepID=UPI002420C0D4|nr:NmrA family NAD(P)-binding protein [Nannocystis sp.]MBK9757566.1 NmrA family NAD(P)-binding protein [Nannocystis sp.]